MMPATLLVLFSAGISVVLGSTSCPSDGNLSRTGLTILAYNDLSNSPEPGSGAILSTRRSEFSSALQTCREIHEDLIGPETTQASLKHLLRYQIYQGNYRKKQLFWVSATPEGECRAVDPKGRIHARHCADQLPALCTQSAPTSNSTFENASAPYQITRQLGQGQITGYRDFFAWKFLGVRFAAQPGRFDYSAVFENEHNSTTTALTWPNACFQSGSDVKREHMSEDCLFVNVWTPYLPALQPKRDHVKLKPVMVWIHGGSYQTGSPSAPDHDGTGIASRGDVVVVALSYRLGNLGFLPFNDGIHNGSYAIGDMVTALEWVAKNIATFGGDANNVTLIGESAGASAVHALIGSPKAKGLLHKVIGMSDPYGLNLPFFNYDRYDFPLSVYNSSTVQVLEQTSCLDVPDQLACLREADPYTIVTNLTVNYQFPTQDGKYIVAPKYNFTDPNALSSEIPGMFGVLKDESGNQAPVPPENATIQSWISSGLALGWIGVPVDLTPFFQAVNGSGISVPLNATRDEIFNASSHVLTDALYTCLNQAMAYSATKHGSLKEVYLYSFNRSYNMPGDTISYCDAPRTEARPYGDPDQLYYHCHGDELMILFGVLTRQGLPDRDGFDVPFSQVVMDYWTAFVRTGDPNPDLGYLEARGYAATIEQTRGTPWAPVRHTEPLVRELQWNGRMIPFVDGSICAALQLPLNAFEINQDL